MKKRAPVEHRAYSILEIKSVQSDERKISGIATTPETDRMGDIVEPMGAQFKNPLPLLWQHQHGTPVGQATFGKPTKDGIPFEASLPIIDEPGPLKDSVDLAWQSVKAGLVRGVSIGFRAIEYAFMDSGGIRFIETEVYELSLVTIPANASATIQAIKSIDSAALAALGNKGKESEASPGASGHRIVKLQEETDMTTKTIGDQIADFEATRDKKAKALMDIINKAAESGETLDAEQADQHDTLESEIESIDKHLERLRKAEKIQMTKAQPVTEENSRRVATPAPIRVDVTQKKAPGVAFAQYARCIALSHLHHKDPVDFARALYPDDGRIEALTQKTAVAAATSGSGTWAGNLVSDEGAVFADFVEFLRPQTILGRFGQGGIPSLRNVPFRTPLVGQTSGGAGYWVGEGQAKPLTKFDFSRTTLDPLKVANIAVATKEVIRDSSPSADILIRDGLAGALRERLDTDFIDPSKSASSGVSPASVLNGVSAIPSVGGADADAVRQDLQALFGAFIAADNAPTTGVFVMTATTALALSLITNPLGQREFEGISMSGGMFSGIPVIVSEYVPSGVVALINASDIYLADEGGIEIDMSREASLQMDDAPDNPATDSTVMVSLWQRNMVGFLAERTINWSRRRTGSVAHLSGVNWGINVSSS